MRAVLQRVSRAAVRVEGQTVGSIERGILVLLGVMDGDGEPEAQRLATKIARFRIFPDDSDRMNLSSLDLSEAEPSVSILVVSQFTLSADGRRGRRPSFDRAAPPDVARPLYGRFCEILRGLGLNVATGQFQAKMEVELVNEGPATFVLDEDPA